MRLGNYGRCMMSYINLLETYKGKRIFITGHTGFKGAWLTFMLHKLGAEIYAVSLNEPADKNHAYYALGVKALISNKNDFIQDITNFEAIHNAIEHFKPHFLFHLAAQAIVSTSYKDPLLTFKTNILGTTHLLESIRLYEEELTAVIITSDKCYKNKERMEPYREEEEMGGDDPYSASKGSCELVFNAYMQSYFKESSNKHISSTRAGNVFGGGDWSANRLIPDCIRDILHGEGEVTIRSPDAIRPWTFVIEILYGYLLLGAKLEHDKSLQGSWNFASGETRTVEQVCNSIITHLGTGSININRETTIGKESGLLLIDENKAKKTLNWKPIYSLEQAFTQTADWYLKQFKGADMNAFSHAFIEDYFEMVA